MSVLIGVDPHVQHAFEVMATNLEDARDRASKAKALLAEAKLMVGVNTLAGHLWHDAVDAFLAEGGE